MQRRITQKDGASIPPARAKVTQLETGRTVTSSRVSGPRAAVGGFPYPGHRTVAEIDAQNASGRTQAGAEGDGAANRLISAKVSNRISHEALNA